MLASHIYTCLSLSCTCVTDLMPLTTGLVLRRAYIQGNCIFENKSPLQFGLCLVLCSSYQIL